MTLPTWAHQVDDQHLSIDDRGERLIGILTGLMEIGMNNAFT